MNSIVTIIEILAVVVAVPVTLSYAFAWYEAANEKPELLAQRFRPGNLVLALYLLLQESLCLLLCVILHPTGWFKPFNPLATANKETPTILLHGLFQNHACWWWLRLRLRLSGHRAVHVINLPPWRDIETLTERLGKKVDQLRIAQGSEKVNLIGHSMGGIIARNYIRLRGGSSRVERCILLGAPNYGSRLIPFAVSPLARTIMPGSAFLQRLNQSPPAPDTVVTNIYSRHDNMVLPTTFAKLDTAVNIEVGGIGHIALLFHPRAYKIMLKALADRPA